MTSEELKRKIYLEKGWCAEAVSMDVCSGGVTSTEVVLCSQSATACREHVQRRAERDGRPT